MISLTTANVNEKINNSPEDSDPYQEEGPDDNAQPEPTASQKRFS